MIAYPSIPLPSTSLSGASTTPVVRTDLETGLIEQEGRFAAKLKTFNANWQLSFAEFAIFEEWHAEDLAGGVLVFGLDIASEGLFQTEPFRFVGGNYSATIQHGHHYEVTATLESLQVAEAASNRTPPVAPWNRILLDPVIDQPLTFAHRNAILTSRPDIDSVRTLRVYPPTDPSQYIYFGLRSYGLGDTLITSIDVETPPVFPLPSFPNLPGVNAGMIDSGSRTVSRLDMDGGWPRQWVEFDTTLKTYSVSWEFSLAQFVTFQNFFFATLKSGSLPFMLTLPVDGLVYPVPVRFVGGVFSQTYSPHNRWRVSAQLERQVAQTASPTEWRPYGLYYSPEVLVVANKKIYAEDAMKMFVANPVEGQTIALHIYDLDIEFGVLKIGPGDVLITRGPFTLDIGIFPEAGVGAFTKPSFELQATILELSVSGDSGIGSFLKPALQLLSTTVELSVQSENAETQFSKPTLEVLDVLLDLGAVAPESAETAFKKPTIELIVP